MPWNARDAMSLREEFVSLAHQPDANIRELCRRFSISPQTGYKWLKRFEQDGWVGLQERSRRPQNSPKQADSGLEDEVLAVRKAHPAWGGRKISHILGGRIAPSTVTNVLHRHDLILPSASEAAQKWHRFEREAPNELWQMDFKGQFKTNEGLCYPLTMVDDHSRFNLIIQACAHQHSAIVQKHLTTVFRRYGLPVQINTDNGPPWGAPRNPGELTPLGIWLVRLGIRLTWSRPAHPQTNGKTERFHRTLKAEVLNGRSFVTFAETQLEFDLWRQVYNHERPHEALGYKTPVERYRISNRAFPERLPELEYSPDDTVVKVSTAGLFCYRKRYFQINKGLVGLLIAIRPKGSDGDQFEVYFGHHRIGKYDFNDAARGR